VSSVDGLVRVWAVRAGALELVTSGRLPVTPQGISTSEISRLTAQERSRVGRPVRLIPPTLKGQFGAPIISNRGDIWILRTSQDPFSSAEPTAREYLVVPLDGRAQYRVVLPAGFVLYAVENDLLLGKRRTENDVDIVQIWRLPEQPR
jgi:hypothetical protein